MPLTCLMVVALDLVGLLSKCFEGALVGVVSRLAKVRHSQCAASVTFKAKVDVKTR